MPTIGQPKRIISAHVLARRLGLSRQAIAKHIRRGVIVPDFRSDAGHFFDPDRLAELSRAIAENKRRKWRNSMAA